MTNRYTMLPAMLVVVITFLTLFAIMSGRSNDTGLVGDADYPHHICTIDNYCEGPECSRDPMSFIVYLKHANGQPLLEMPRVNPIATMTALTDGIAVATRGGEVSGVLNIYADRHLDFAGTSGEAKYPVEHYGTGKCERLQTP